MSNTVRNLDMLVEFFSTTIFQDASSQNLWISQGDQGFLTQPRKALSIIHKVARTCRPLWKEVSETSFSRSHQGQNHGGVSKGLILSQRLLQFSVIPDFDRTTAEGERPSELGPTHVWCSGMPPPSKKGENI